MRSVPTSLLVLEIVPDVSLFFRFDSLWGNFLESNKLGLFQTNFPTFLFQFRIYLKKTKTNKTVAAATQTFLACSLSGYFRRLYHLHLKFLSISAAFLDKWRLIVDIFFFFVTRSLAVL